VLLNLSRDQLHRNPEVLSLAKAWREALVDVPIVVANVDDPAVVWAARAAKQQVWVAAGQEWSQDSLTCPSCGQLLDRVDERWSCRCGFRRPRPTWVIEDGRVLHHGTEVPVSPTLPGAVNLANATMAVATATACGVPPGDAAAAVATVRDVAGRFALVRYGDHEVRLILAKNPAGWQAAMHITQNSDAPLVVAFNSDGVDGRDPSWLYDVDFDAWRDRTVAVCGRRATDMTVRLRTDGIEPLGQFGDLPGALRSLPPGPVDLVANYTAFQEARKVLAHG
jgi:UDP-N-acetylmuramyl tripeptide synthase